MGGNRRRGFTARSFIEALPADVCYCARCKVRLGAPQGAPALLPGSLGLSSKQQHSGAVV